jgi:hypothetical protein
LYNTHASTNEVSIGFISTSSHGSAILTIGLEMIFGGSNLSVRWNIERMYTPL